MHRGLAKPKPTDLRTRPNPRFKTVVGDFQQVDDLVTALHDPFQPAFNPTEDDLAKADEKRNARFNNAGVAMIPAELSVEWDLVHDMTNITIASRARSFSGRTPAEVHFDTAEAEFRRLVDNGLGSERIRVLHVGLINNKWELDEWEERKRILGDAGKPTNSVWCLCATEEANMRKIIELGFGGSNLGLPGAGGFAVQKGEGLFAVKGVMNALCLGLGEKHVNRTRVSNSATSAQQQQQKRTHTVRDNVLLVRVLPGKISRVRGKNAFDGFDSMEQDNLLWLFTSSQAIATYVVSFEVIYAS
eukprot:c2346_g1_i1.p1 GENE.c2346_g1_i1~~c2346_g1_i1.p1  ORF type:complete len:322 (-),score=88.50 c2346_g1_i1:85-990(-)